MPNTQPGAKVQYYACLQLFIGRGQQTSSVKVQVANILGFAGHIWSLWQSVNFLKAVYTIHKEAWLHSNKSLWTLKHEFHVSLNAMLLLFSKIIFKSFSYELYKNGNSLNLAFEL